MKVLVLGGGGFIGGHIAKHFKDLKNHVTIVDLKEHNYFKRSEICDEYIIADLRNLDVVLWIFETEYDEVYQLASDVGGAGYIFSGLNDADIISNSVIINLNIVKQYKKIKKLFFSSSSCAYPVPEGSYGYEKLFSEKLYLAFANQYGIDVKIARFQNVYGTHDRIGGDKERFITSMCRKVAQANDFIEVWGDGSQMRSFIYVQDCIDFVFNLMWSDKKEPVNIGFEKQVSINDIAQLIINISGKNLKIKNIFGKEFYDKYGFDCPVGVTEKLSAVGYRKEISKQGLIETYNWVNEN
jgi:GDP-D-mannose 3',5'-epimerase